MGLTKKLLLFVLGWALSSSLWAVTCTDIFSNGLQAHASNGTINLGYQTRINGGTSTLQTKNLSDNSQHLACNGATCVPSGVPSSTSTVTFQTGSAANGAINVPYQGNSNVSAGDYGFANVEQEGSLRFNTNNGTYLIRGLSTKFRSEIRFRAGDYWIDGDVTLSQETVLRRVTASGSTRIFVRGNVTIGYQVTTDSFTADQLLIYATGNIYIAQASNLHGFLYAGGNLDIGYGVTINGAAAGASVYANAGQSITNYQSSLLAAGNFAPFCSGVSTTPVLLGSWRMDEGFWNGTANEVIDSSGNGNHGRASIAAGSTPLPTTESGSPAFISGNQNTCYYGSFDRTTSPLRSYSYVELTGFPTLPNGFTFAAWIRSTNAGAQHQRILVRDDAQNGWGLSLADGTGQPKLRFFARNITNNGAVSGQGTNPSCGVFCIDTTAVLTSNAWFYVAAAVDTTAKTVTLYVYNQSGVLQARTSGAYSGTWTDGSGAAAIGGETSASAEGRQTSWHFLGNIDEVNIYSGALAQTSIESLMRTVRTCAGPDHYELQIASENVACEGAVVTVRACANSLVPCTVDMSVNTNVGLATTAGSLAASTVTLSNGQATTRLLYPAAADGATAILNMENEQTIAVNARKCCTGSSSCTVANSCSTQFKTAGFIFSNTATATGNIANQIAGTTDNNVYLRAVKTNTATGACVARFSSPQNVQLAYQCINPTTCIAGQHLYLGGTSVQANAAATPVASLVYTSKALNFDSNGSAAIPLNYTDAGQLRLRARLALGSTATEPAYTLTGTSNDLVVKPHRLVVASVVGASNQPNPGSSGSGSGFIAAGESFKVNLEARNASGAITPNFGREQVPEFSNLGVSANSLVYPTGGTLTALNNGGSFAATATQGRFENSNYSWNQVGSITLVPALGDNDYLGAGNIPNLPASSTVGRFYPYQYRLSSATSSNSCGSFSYMGQPAINLTYALQAESVTGAILTNYDNTDQATLYAGAASLSYVAEDANNGTNLGSRVLMPVQTWNNGQVMFNSNTLEFARQASGAPDGPFNSLQLGLQLSDSLDNRPLAGLDMNPGTNLVCSGASCTAKTLGNPLQLRYGRLRLEDAFGPESVDLPVNFYTQYWSGNFFVKNSSDSCTRILRSAISYPAGNLLTPANLTVALSGGSTQGVYNSLTASEVVFTSGDAGHSFLAPGTGTGSFPVDVDLTTYPWLRYDWNQNGDYSDTALPRANFGFGQYRGHDRIIYWRERLE